MPHTHRTYGVLYSPDVQVGFGGGGPVEWHFFGPTVIGLSVHTFGEGLKGLVVDDLRGPIE